MKKIFLLFCISLATLSYSNAQFSKLMTTATKNCNKSKVCCKEASNCQATLKASSVALLKAQKLEANVLRSSKITISTNTKLTDLDQARILANQNALIRLKNLNSAKVETTSSANN